LLRHTRLGDANLSGATDINDFSRLAANFNQNGYWATGDLNYDFGTNITDFAILAANFNQSLSSAAPVVARAPFARASRVFSDEHVGAPRLVDELL
jgi:hypothetical protein